MSAIRAAVVTVSDKGFAGEREDVSGPLLSDLLEGMGAAVECTLVVPDERADIEGALLSLADDSGFDLVVTTGGTGPAPRDVTPEATLAVVDRQVPGIAEVLRSEGYRQTPLAVLSRGLAGIRGQTLIVNLPGSPSAVRDGMRTLLPILPHAVKMLQGIDTEHEPERHGE
jgi:molybdopterin adenylyltransferase